MESNTIIEKIRNFFEDGVYLDKLRANIRKGKHAIIVDFQDLCKFDPELSEQLLDQPEDFLEWGKMIP